MSGRNVKKSVLIMLLSLFVILSLAVPAVTSAARPPQTLNASGSILSIDEGVVIPAGGKWVIVKREISGVVSGDINGAFTMTYRGSVDTFQAGEIHGTVKVGKANFAVRGTSHAVDYEYIPQINSVVPKITVTGQYTGGGASGSLVAVVYFVPTPDMQHILYVLPFSYFVLYP